MTFIQTIALFDVSAILALALTGFLGYREWRPKTFFFGFMEGAHAVLIGTAAASFISILWQLMKA